jgi:hypothetical protein
MVRSARTHDAHQHCNADPQSCAEDDETPKGRQSNEEYQGASGGKDQANKSTTDREFVHGYARMRFLSHTDLASNHDPTGGFKTQGL